MQLQDLERHYRTLCPSIREICFLPGNRAVVVPDFAYLRLRHVVNSANLIRFEMDGAAQQLPSHDRHYELILRSMPLPRLGSRVDRTWLTEQIRNRGDARKPIEPVTASEARLLNIIRQFRPDAPVSSGMNIEIDLGFDSLERIQLIAAIEQSFGLEIPSGELDTFLTVGDLVRFLQCCEVPDRGIVVPSWHEVLNAPLTAAQMRQERLILGRRTLLRSVAFPVLYLALLLTRLVFRIRSSGSRDLPPGGFAFCVNHNSHLDPLFLACALPLPVVRRLLFLGFSDYFVSGRFAWLWRMLRVAPIDPDRYACSGLRLAVAGLRRNLILCVFPEGSRSANGQLQPFQRGLAVVATELGLPVVPVAIIGSYAVLPRGANRIRVRPVEVRFGTRLMPSSSPEDFSGRLHSAVNRLLAGS
jgi:long-chain acyl-CoA synthetase